MRTVLYHGDCYEVLPQLIEQGVKVDLILTDPPYKINISCSGGKGKITQNATKSTKQLEFVSEGWDYVHLLRKFAHLQDIPNMIFFCCNDQVGELQTYFAGWGLNVEICVWNKYNAIPITNGHLMNDIEFILTVRGKGATFNNKLPSNMKRRVFTEPLVANKVHPCEKPLKILDNLVQLYSKENDTILDCFMGSGTTGVSAVKNNRNFIGIEKEKKYFKIAQQRIDAENHQTKLF